MKYAIIKLRYYKATKRRNGGTELEKRIKNLKSFQKFIQKFAYDSK